MNALLEQSTRPPRCAAPPPQCLAPVEAPLRTPGRLLSLPFRECSFLHPTNFSSIRYATKTLILTHPLVTTVELLPSSTYLSPTHTLTFPVHTPTFLLTPPQQLIGTIVRIRMRLRHVPPCCAAPTPQCSALVEAPLRTPGRSLSLPFRECSFLHPTNLSSIDTPRKPEKNPGATNDLCVGPRGVGTRPA